MERRAALRRELPEMYNHAIDQIADQVRYAPLISFKS